jgi:uncharacterized protein YyaL (SSP411 family)
MPNRLAQERSPYLLLHADDPVDWMPWGDEAFELARDTDRPVFLSIGFSACHWCHVFQRESFRDTETAAYLNEHFVSVKVDREVRPDIDKLYMDFTIGATGSGGWPMTVFVSPEKVPFFAGTYFPKHGAPGIPSFMEVLDSVHDAWTGDRAEVDEVLARSAEFLDKAATPLRDDRLTGAVVDFGARAILSTYDEQRGGFGPAPKFPQFTTILFLLAYVGVEDIATLAPAIHGTLTAIVRGGIYDQVGGGVARYSTDADWLVPHFEKLLPEQGLMLSALAEAAVVAGPGSALAGEYGHVARQTAAFMRRELAADGGGFIAALSAEAGGVEGASYGWEYTELAELLGPDLLKLSEDRLGVTPEGNWHKRTILTRPGGRGMDAEAVDVVLDRLRVARDAKTQPDPDTKVVTGWNAIAARGLIEAGAAFADETMLAEGVALVRMLLIRAVRDDGVVRVLDDPRDDEVRIAEDAAALTAATLTAHEATGDPGLLAAARGLFDDALARFADSASVFMAPADSDLPVRPYHVEDAPLPSASAMLIESAARLYFITGNDEPAKWARSALRRHTPIARKAPSLAGTAMAAAIVLADASVASRRRRWPWQKK